MIFNPLFLSDTGSSQTLTAKTTKLSQNKYLFSDIVKVIMNPLMDQESKSLNKAGNNLAITLANGEMPLEMRLNLLSDLDIELSAFIRLAPMECRPEILASKLPFT